MKRFNRTSTMKYSIFLIFTLNLFAFQLWGQGRSYDAATEFMRFNSNWIEFRKKAVRKIAPVEELKKEHSLFLAKKNTGIVRLINPKSCVSDIQIHPSTGYKKYEKLLTECPERFIVGGASSYSFRGMDFAPTYKADIEIKNGLMFSTGLLNQTIFVDIGEVDLESVSLTSSGAKFLTAFIPAEAQVDATKQSDNLRKGITQDNFKYSNFLMLAENHTYLLRSIAYRGEAKIVSSTGLKYEYNRLQDDIRKDIVIAFRIIKLNTDQSVILLWKEIDRKNSPKLKVNE